MTAIRPQPIRNQWHIQMMRHVFSGIIPLLGLKSWNLARAAPKLLKLHLSFRLLLTTGTRHFPLYYYDWKFVKWTTRYKTHSHQVRKQIARLNCMTRYRNLPSGSVEIKHFSNQSQRNDICPVVCHELVPPSYNKLYRILMVPFI